MDYHRSRPWQCRLAVLALTLIAVPAAGLSAEPEQGRSGAPEAAPHKEAPGVAKPPKGKAVRPPGKGVEEAIPEEIPPPGNDGCPFFEQRLELMV